MIDADIKALIYQLELTTKKLISGPLQGDWQSASKGAGFEFHQLRDYIQGDDIRFIDWKASARTQKMLVRQYLEDRNRIVYILLDVSASTNYGTGSLLKADLMKKLATVLAFVSLHRKDSVGLLLFTREVEKFMPARQTRNHVLALARELFEYEPQYRETNISAALEYLGRLKGQRAIVCLISDFIDGLDQNLLSIVARRHELIAFRCLDEREMALADVGTLIIEDVETGARREVSGSSGQKLASWHAQQKQVLALSKVDCLDLIVQKPFTGPLVRFLRQRNFQ